MLLVRISTLNDAHFQSGTQVYISPFHGLGLITFRNLLITFYCW